MTIFTQSRDWMSMCKWTLAAPAQGQFRSLTMESTGGSRLGHIPYKFRQNYLFGLTTSSDYSTSSHHHQAKNRQASVYSPMYPKRLWEEVLERWTQNNWPLPPRSANTKWHQIKPWGKRVKRNPMINCKTPCHTTLWTWTDITLYRSEHCDALVFH